MSSPSTTPRPTFWAAPASKFVEEFLGGERTLRRLALVPVSTLELDPPPLDGTDLPSVDCDRSAREALDLLLSTGASALLVTRDGTALGSATLATLSRSVGGADLSPSRTAG